MSYRCVCGYVIKNTSYPCPEAGDLKWQPESENASQDSSEALKEYFAAVENGTKDEWLLKFFNRVSFYRTADVATIVYDIVSRFYGMEGHSVFRCPNCERLYIQKEYSSDEYECFEKRQNYSR